MKYNYTVTLPDGGVVKRKASARVYTHVSICSSGGRAWRIACWHTRKDLAQANVRSLAKQTSVEAKLLAVNPVPVKPRQVAHV